MNEQLLVLLQALGDLSNVGIAIVLLAVVAITAIRALDNDDE